MSRRQTNAARGMTTLRFVRPRSAGRARELRCHRRSRAWLPDGYSQIFRLYVFDPSGFWTMAPLRCKICHLATFGLSLSGGKEKEMWMGVSFTFEKESASGGEGSYCIKEVGRRGRTVCRNISTPLDAATLTMGAVRMEDNRANRNGGKSVTKFNITQET